MNHSQDDPLDHLLVNWADQTAANEQDCESLKNRISETLISETSETVGSASVRSTTSRWTLAVGLATAAAMLLAVGVWALYNNNSNGLGPDIRSGGVAKKRISDPPLAPSLSKVSQKRLWQEHKSVFGSQLAWIGERDGKIEVSLNPSSTDQEVEDVVSVRLVLCSRPKDGQNWKEIQVTHVLALSEQVVEIRSDDGGAAPVQIWAYPIDKLLISIDLRYRPDVPGCMPVEESVLQRVGEQTKVCSFEVDGVEYRLFQTTDFISNENLG